MAETALAVIASSIPGATVTDLTPDAANGNKFVNDGRTIMVVTVGGTATTLVINSPKQCDQGAVHNGGAAAMTSVIKTFGPFRKDEFDQSDGTVTMTWDQITAVTCQVISMPGDPR